MCGINVIFSTEHSLDGRSIIGKMNACIAHRGPDDEGYYSGGSKSRIFLGHRRLSIIDLSSAGHQPMVSDDQRFIVVLNGEIYNYQDLRLELSRAKMGSTIAPYDFNTQSDTEVLLAAYKAWGKDCVERLDGMFAFAIWDTEKEELFLARDRFGKKPLYFTKNENSWVFSSEIRGILASGLIAPRLDHEALGEYYQYQTVYGTRTILKDVHLLEAGHWLMIRAGESRDFCYWHPTRESEKHYLVPETDPAKAKQKVRDLLFSAVEKRLVADVPFGAFLSGGIDSSTVVGIMAQVSSSKVKTFSVTFKEQEFSEQKYAEQVAEKFKTDHTNISLSADDFLTMLPQAMSAMDHPGGDGPNTYVVSGVTKRAGITMALSGIGGDELFAGYDVFRRLPSVLKKWWLNLIPPEAREALSLPASGFKRSVRQEKLRSMLGSRLSFQDQYELMRQVFSERQVKEMLTDFRSRSLFNDSVSWFPENRLLSNISLAEIRTYLCSVLLRDTDVMSMAHGLEVRAPFLDHALAEYVLSLSDQIKFPHTPKKLLTEAVSDILPLEVIHRKKMGFTLPWEHWMKNELKEWCERRLRSLSNRSFIGEKKPIDLWVDFLEGKPTITWSRLWHLIVLEDWLERHHINE